MRRRETTKTYEEKLMKQTFPRNQQRYKHTMAAKDLEAAVTRVLQQSLKYAFSVTFKIQFPFPLTDRLCLHKAAHQTRKPVTDRNSLYDTIRQGGIADPGDQTKVAELAVKAPSPEEVA